MSVSRGIRARIAVMTPAERFWPRVEKTDSCWIWTGAGYGCSRGYGRFQACLGSQKLVQAHRFAYELIRGRIPDGLQIDHLCRNRFCVNPDHLEAVTARVNVHRSANPCALNAVKTHCPRGHAYQTFGRLDPRGGKRYCRECQRLVMRQRRAAEVAGQAVEIETTIRVRRRA